MRVSQLPRSVCQGVRARLAIDILWVRQIYPQNASGNERQDYDIVCYLDGGEVGGYLKVQLDLLDVEDRFEFGEIAGIRTRVEGHRIERHSKGLWIGKDDELAGATCDVGEPQAPLQLLAWHKQWAF